MRNIAVIGLAVGISMSLCACSKKDDNKQTTDPGARTVANLSGSYNLTAATTIVSGVTVDIYNSGLIPDCEKDNVIQLNTDGTAKFVDAGTQCVPPSDSTGTWSLSKNTDSLYVGNVAYYIKSWNGKSLMANTVQTVTGYPTDLTVTVTLVKQ